MKIGEVLRKERDRKSLSADDVASRLGVSTYEYSVLESGESPLETLGQWLGRIAIELETPTSRLITVSGKSAQASQEDGQCGKLIQRFRTFKGLTREELAKKAEIHGPELTAIENGASEIEKYAPMLLRFAEIIDQPVFNLLYPCGLPADQLDDYP